mgnify:FL=1
MDIFDMIQNKTLEKDAPLAARIRPKTLDEVVGQEHILGKDKLLYRAIKADKLGSLILYGPPGTGKTTLAKVIANTTKSHFIQLNATIAGKKDIQQVVEEAKDNLSLTMKKTILFIDEIHRFNKAQQDALLPHVEDGTVTLIGATTENPYFEVNSALVSRSRIFELKPLTSENIKALIYRSIQEDIRLKEQKIDIEEAAVTFLADISGGDARAALNAIELASLTTDPDEAGVIHLTLPVVEECIQKRAIGYDKKGDNHYDTISAFIKSMRGSDPDAAIYYLARMLYAGEDPKFIARRIVICAAEDVGNADPQALVLANAAASAINFIGMPEGQIILCQAAAYVATAPKSNAAVNAIFAALADVKEQSIKTIPPHLQDAHYRGAGDLGHGIGYKYAHDYKNHYVEQQFLPDELVGTTYYAPANHGYEKKIREWMAFIQDEAKDKKN